MLVGKFYVYLSGIFGSSLGYFYYEPDYLKIIFAFLISIVPSVWMKMETPRASVAILWFLYYFYYIPSVNIVIYVIDSSVWGVVLWQIFFLISFSLASLASFFRLVAVRKISINRTVYWFFILLIAIVFFLYILSSFGVEYNLASLTDVYGQRNEFSQRISTESVLIGYFIILSGYWLAPLLVISGVRAMSTDKKMASLLIGVGFLLSLYIYSLAAYKSVALGFFITLFFYFYFRRVENIGFRVSVFIIGFFLLSVVFGELFDFTFVEQHVVRRLLIVPGMHSSFYYELFDKQNILDFGGMSAPLVISNIYYGLSGSANSGYISAAYAQAGFIGVIAVGIVLGGFLYIIDCYSKGAPAHVVISLYLMSTYALANSGFGTVLLTYGMGLMLVSVYLLISMEKRN